MSFWWLSFDENYFLLPPFQFVLHIYNLRMLVNVLFILLFDKSFDNTQQTCDDKKWSFQLQYFSVFLCRIWLPYSKYWSGNVMLQDQAAYINWAESKIPIYQLLPENRQTFWVLDSFHTYKDFFWPLHKYLRLIHMAAYWSTPEHFILLVRTMELCCDWLKNNTFYG